MTTNLARDTPMEKARIQAGDLFVYGLGPGTQGSIWMVARALDSEMLPKDDARWPEITGGNAAGPLKADGTGGDIPDLSYLATAEATERTWLRPDVAKNEMWQVFTGITPPLMYVYREYPRGNRHGGLSGADVPNLSATAVSTWGWTWAGYESFIDRPTVASMFLLPYRVTVAHAIFNRASYNMTPRLLWWINKIRFEALDPDDREDAKLIQKVLRTQIEPKVRWSPGLKGFRYEPGFKNVFGVDPVIQTRRQLFVQKREGTVPLVEEQQGRGS